MIPEQIPVKNHKGNNSATVFDFDFYIENDEQLKVTHTDLDGYETVLTYGVDYSIHEFKNMTGSYITFPLQGSSYSVLAWDIQTGKKEILSIALELPVEQPAEYDMSGDLNKKNLELSLDYLTRLIQILYRQLAKTIKVKEGSDQSVDEFIEELRASQNLARKWAEYTGGTVDGAGYSSKYHASESYNYAQQAELQADRAREYADCAEFGMKWVGFTTANWTADDDKYKLTLSDVPVIDAVYKGSYSTKELVANINIKTTSTGSVLTSYEAFDGFILSAINVLGTYEHEQTLASDEWIIDHNTGHYPCVTLLDSNNIVMDGTVHYVSLNRIKVTFTQAVTGKAILR